MAYAVLQNVLLQNGNGSGIEVFDYFDFCTQVTVDFLKSNH
jgi:hypothetical protein